ncbi:hypothetical protein KQ945_11670 [Bacillus subtilis subsp. subtilis]|nr:hypothetical protein [Bacillus subtilis subsp. subtilis]
MEMLAYLGLVPIGLSGAGFMLRNAGRSMLDRAVDAASAPSDTPAGSVPGGAVAASAVPSVAVLGAEMQLGVMHAADVLLDMADALPRPSLDGRFHDRDGLPLLVSADKDLDDTSVVQVQMPGFTTRDGERRAMALLEPVADALMGQALLALPALEVAEEKVVAGLRRREEQVVGQVLAIELLVPADWSASLRTYCADWLHARAAYNGLDRRRFSVNVAVASNALDVWSRLQHVVDSLAQGEPRWYLVLSCSSAVDAGTIAAWLDSNRILHRRNKDGQIPGEGAAGLLLASASLAAAESPHLWRPHRVERVQGLSPAESRRQAEALGRAMPAEVGISAERVGFALHDADQRSQVAVDACAAAVAANPDLEIDQQTLALPVCAGELGPVLPLALLTLAHAHVLRSQNAALVMSVGAPAQRVAAIIDIPVSKDPSTDTVSAA